MMMQMPTMAQARNARRRHLASTVSFGSVSIGLFMAASICEKVWRRRRDSNPRTRGYRVNGFRDRRIQPLCHPSAWGPVWVRG